MKRIILIFLLLMLVSFPAGSDEGEENCVGSSVTDYQNQNRRRLHNHCFEDKDTDTNVDTNTRHGSESGVGADIVLWQNDKADPLIEEVSAEYRYDIKNRNHQTYGVARINLWRKIKQLLK